MEQNIKNTNSAINNVIGQLSAERKKVVPAICLILLMIFMWGRVIFEKEPQTATAMTQYQQKDVVEESQLKITFVELDKVKGRNDVLSRDFFAVNDDRLGGIQQVSGQSGDIGEVAEKLKLQAIGGGENPQAFINDKLLSVGDTLSISHASSLYECEVVRIEENMVVVKCREDEIKLILAPEVEAAD